MKNTILITGIGGPTPRSIAKTIRKKFPDFKIIGIDANPKAFGFFIPGLLDVYYKVPRADSKDYWTFIKNLIEKEKIEMAFVQPEKEVIEWGNYYEKNGSYPCPVLIPPKDLAVSLMDKAIMSNLLKDTKFIPKTIKITHSNPCLNEVDNYIGFPCWIRAVQGSGGFGSMKLENLKQYDSWLLINKDIEEFTISEFLPGRHLANQMLYYDGEYIKGASLECVEYVMANIAPSKITGNTSFGKFINESAILKFCDECIMYICNKLSLKAHGVLSFDLKEDSEGHYKVTEINIRHMAYTGIMAQIGFDLISDTINILLNSNVDKIKKKPFFNYDKAYIFLRDVDIEPIVLENESKILY